MGEEVVGLDPAETGWDSEVFGDLAAKQLQRFGAMLNAPNEIDFRDLAKLVTADFRCGPLRPPALVEVFADQGVTASRAAEDTPVRLAEHEGIAGAAAALTRLAEPFEGASEVRVKFKVIRVVAAGPRPATSVYYQATAVGRNSIVQQNATWHCEWTPGTEADPPRLTRIETEAYEEVARPSKKEPLFADCTEAVLADNRSFREQLLPGLDHWRAMIPKSLGVNVYGHEGIALGDVNGDGLEDLYVCQPAGLPNRLYLHNEDGTLTDASSRAGVDFLDHTRSALFIDYDNDGDQDLVLGIGKSVTVLSNDGTGRFTVQSSPSEVFAYSLAAADFDLDGDLDIYVCSYGTPDTVDRTPMPYHDANNGRANVFLRNEGDGKFSDITRESGLDVNNRRYSFAASWEDYDNDGDLDLYVANDFGRNNLYRNDAGSFVDVAAEAGVEDISAGMSVSWGDYNNDGWMDLYVANMFSSAGNRVTYQRRFKSAADALTTSQFRRHARGNSLFENAGDGTFRDVSVQANVTMGRWAWGSNFIDINNDSYEDLVVANGFITHEDTGDL